MNNRVKRVLLGYRHKNYARTVEVADFARRIITGEGYGELVIRYKPRESEAQKEQRVEITQDRTSSVESKAAGLLQRPFRTDKLIFKLKHPETKTLERFAMHSEKYGDDGQSLIVWCEEMATYYNRLDPNIMYWVKHSRVNNVDDFEPVIFPSRDVLDFENKKGAIKYAVCRMFEMVTYEKTNQQCQTPIPLLYYFGEEGLEISIEVDKEVKQYSTYYDMFAGDDGMLPPTEEVNQKQYITIIVPYEGGGKIPVTRVGYKYDPRTEQMTYVPYFDAAVSQFKQLAKIGSEYDLSQTLHTFLQKVQYYTPCKYIHKNQHICKHGTLKPSGEVCPNCKGSGKEIHTSSQDIIEIKLPSGHDEKFISPKDLVHYVDMKMDIVKHQQEEVDKYSITIPETIYGVDLSKQLSGNVTARQVNNFADQAQDKIFEFTKSPRKMYLFTIEVMLDVLGITGMEYGLEYSNEYNLESEKFLLELLALAKTNGANPNIIGSIEDRIIQKQNRTDSAYIAVYNVMKRFQPFGGLEPEIKQQIILQLNNGDIQKAIYLNFKQITDRILLEVPEFVALDYKRQAEIVEGYAKEYAETMKEANSPRTMRDALMGDIDDLTIEEEIEEEDEE